MRVVPPLLVACALGAPAFGGSAEAAIAAFNTWCFKAGQTEAQARANMGADTAPFTLTFWDDSLEPRPAKAPQGVERRCELAFDGDHPPAAIAALHDQMATPPVFGHAIALPDTHTALPGTAFLQGRELLRGRVAVVHVGTRDTDGTRQTFMAVDRLYDGLGLEVQQ
tara:strand:- start:1724 stop:2224 length:501 start_codon:yes stop_codon:yes gene_type:complete